MGGEGGGGGGCGSGSGEEEGEGCFGLFVVGRWVEKKREEESVSWRERNETDTREASGTNEINLPYGSGCSNGRGFGSDADHAREAR